MSLSKHHLLDATDVTEQRMIEIRFHLFFETIYRYYEKQHVDTEAFLDSLFRLTGIPREHAMTLVNFLQRRQYKPSKTELIVTSKHLNWNVKRSMKLMRMSQTTYYSHIQEYIMDGEYDLEPRFSENDRELMQEFLEATSFLEMLGMVFKNA